MKNRMKRVYAVGAVFALVASITPAQAASLQLTP